MRYIAFIFIFTSILFGAVLKTPVIWINNNKTLAAVKVKHVDIGVSGFLVHHITAKHSTIVNNVIVTGFDKKTHIATLKLQNYDALEQNSLPKPNYEAVVGDTVVLAFGYTRGMLIAPSENIYYNITRSSKQLQWIHPDIFATILSFAGHPTPLRSDFAKLSKIASVGLVFIYLNKKIYTVDAKTFKILNITDAPISAKKIKLPFYTRIPEIDAAWWGEGSDEMLSYEPHYFALLKQANPHNKTLLNEMQKYKGQK